MKEEIYSIIDEIFSDERIEDLCQCEREDVNKLKGFWKRKISKKILDKGIDYEICKFIAFLEEEIKILESIKNRFADLEDDFTQGFGFEEDHIAGSIYLDLDRRLDKLKKLYKQLK